MSEIKYMAFAHPSGNNCTESEAKEVLARYWGKIPIVCQNTAFDYAVARKWGFPELPWHMMHDTLYLIFLENPHAPSLSLKESADRILGIKPEERDELKDYILRHFSVKPSDAGRYIGECPGDVVESYAKGDVLRTEALFYHLLPKIAAAGMTEAYDRERQLMPVLLDNEEHGIRLDQAGLEQDLEVYEQAMHSAENWVFKKLGREFNIDSNDELADAIVELDPDANFLVTPTGRRSVNKASLAQAVQNEELKLALGYRSRLATCLSMFMRPWQDIGLRTGGVLNPHWSQVRHTGDGKNSAGARTGRIICSNPNLLNLSKSFEGRNDGYSHPEFLGVPPLPLVRKYLLPDEGHVWLHRDFSQQELRVLAHFEDGSLMEQYNKDPNTDVHEFLRSEIKRILGVDVTRLQTKTLNFGFIYGQGLGMLAETMKIDTAATKELRSAQMKALPGLKSFSDVVKSRGKSGLPIRTWGSRLYYVEEPKVVKGRLQTYEYKLVNYLIQGSSADATKQALIDYSNDREKNSRFLVTVYDEINISAPAEEAAVEMARLKKHMNSLDFDVPMVSDGKIGPTWGNLAKYED
jgi:DNA polymerase-1